MTLRSLKPLNHGRRLSPSKLLKKKSFVFFAAYLAAILTIYIFPMGFGSEWYSFYKYLDEHGIFPYLDVREGYPPIGFLIYMPLYWICNKDPIVFNYCFMLLNGLALTFTLATFYASLRENMDEDRALEYILSYAVLPSVVISNMYSNDVIALLFAVLAIYMMIKERPKLCGTLIGLAALSKGFPALLIVPALIKFRGVKAKVETASLFILTLLLVSLPFLALNPLAYISTFIHHGSRGPWETIWALIDGYYSHGGFLHPYFDKFFYHEDIMKVYTPNHYDHAFYLWRYDWLPNLLTLSQILIIVVLALAYARRPEEAIKLCGLIYLAYMFFFKGYSTQFAVSTSLYLLLASGSIALLIPMEVSHMMQILSWAYIPQINLRNAHEYLLISSILIRTIVFAYVLFSSLRNRISGLREAPMVIIKSLIVVKRFLSNRRTLVLTALTIILGCILVMQVHGYTREEGFFKSFSGSINLRVDRWENITLSGLEGGGKVLVKLSTNTWIEAHVTPSVTIEHGIRNWDDLKGSFNETYLFFRATAEQHVLSLKMAHPKIPFRVTDGFDGDLRVMIEGNGTVLKIHLADEGLDGKDSLFRIAYPYEAYISEDFRVNLEYEIMTVSDAKPIIMLEIFDDVDEWPYVFRVMGENFTLTPETPDIDGHTNLKGDAISLLALSITIKDGEAADILLKNLNINDHKIALFSEDNETVPYEVYIERTFKASGSYIATLLLFTFSAICAFLSLILHAKDLYHDY